MPAITTKYCLFVYETLVKYVLAISEWDDLDEYREYIRHNLGLGGIKESNQGAIPFSIPQLDPGLPDIQEDYVKMMQQLDPVHVLEIANMMVECADTVWKLPQQISGGIIQMK